MERTYVDVHATRESISTEADDEEPFVVFRIPPVPHSSRRVREGVSAFARSLGIAGCEIDGLLTALGEALANAIEHSGERGHIEVDCLATADRIVASVRDFGVGFVGNAEPAELPPPHVERGRGLAIMRRFSDIFAVRSVPGGGTCVVVGRYLRRGRGTSSPPQLGHALPSAPPHGAQNVHS
jgi:anti-sigma regulatory factor (Ser/Thr protein kinase)